jgi:hypothetical protein
MRILEKTIANFAVPTHTRLCDSILSFKQQGVSEFLAYRHASILRSAWIITE